MEIRIYKGKEFRLLDEVYDPGEDSYLLVEAALKDAKPGDRALEVGTGSGIVSLFVSDITQITATDISPYACKNARLNGVSVVRTDLFFRHKGPVRPCHLQPALFTDRGGRAASFVA